MSIAESLLPEFDQEMKVTRTLLERVPEDKGDWKPHPKSYSLAAITTHIANLPRWGVATLDQQKLDLDAPDASDWMPPQFTTTAALVNTFDENIASMRTALAAASDDEMKDNWTLHAGGEDVFTMPRAVVLRSFVFSHIIHHRAQLSVYLRLLDVPLPSIYGPTADTESGEA